VGLGTAIIAFPEYVLIVHNLYCKECGITRYTPSAIPLIKTPKSNIITPKLKL